MNPTNQTKVKTNGTTPSAVVVLSGGAPDSPLAAAALCAIYDKGRTFTTLYTSGAGATIGMLYLAPQKGTTPEALKSILQAGISDEIWNCFPLPYKTFFKSGPFTTFFATWAQSMHLRHSCFDRKYTRLYNDWIDLWAAALCPTDLNFFSQGLCAPYPFIKEQI